MGGAFYRIMLDKETQQKIASCKALAGMTVNDLIDTDRFHANMAVYLTQQREERKAARMAYESMRKTGAKGYKLPAHVVDHFVDVSTDKFCEMFKATLARTINAPFRDRQYIEQLGTQVFNLTALQFIVEAYPELEPVLFPKSNSN